MTKEVVAELLAEDMSKINVRIGRISNTAGMIVENPHPCIALSLRGQPLRTVLELSLVFDGKTPEIVLASLGGALFYVEFFSGL